MGVSREAEPASPNPNRCVQEETCSPSRVSQLLVWLGVGRASFSARWQGLLSLGDGRLGEGQTSRQVATPCASGGQNEVGCPNSPGAAGSDLVQGLGPTSGNHRPGFSSPCSHSHMRYHFIQVLQPPWAFISLSAQVKITHICSLTSLDLSNTSFAWRKELGRAKLNENRPPRNTHHHTHLSPSSLFPASHKHLSASLEAGAIPRWRCAGICHCVWM